MKLYFVYRRIVNAWAALFPKRKDFFTLDCNKIKGFSEVRTFCINEGIFTLNLLNGKSIYLRQYPSSDLDVFGQVFQSQEYLPIIGLVKRFADNDGFVMIDGGANIGLTSCYFARELSISRLICIEPLNSNFDLLTLNIESFGLNAVSILYNNALSPTSGDRYVTSNDFRDGKDWSTVVVPSKNGHVTGVSIGDIIEGNNLKYVSYLKLDIEGSERYLFSDGVNTDYLNSVKVISIEIHQEFSIKDRIVDILESYGFILFDSGELTIGFKPKIFS